MTRLTDINETKGENNQLLPNENTLLVLTNNVRLFYCA